MTHVGNGTAAELIPAAEIGVSVVGVIRPIERRAEPECPVEARRGQEVCPSGRVGNCGHMGRIDQLWISRSVPIAPFLIISTACF